MAIKTEILDVRLFYIVYLKGEQFRRYAWAICRNRAGREGKGGRERCFHLHLDDPPCCQASHKPGKGYTVLPPSPGLQQVHPREGDI